MRAELGTTNDPAALIPGNAAGVAAAATAWRAARDAALQLSEAVFAVSPAESWTGDAAEAFELRRTAAADVWAATGDALDMAASAVDAFVTALTWAQQQAAEAIALWQQGQSATANAREAYRLRERTAAPTDILPAFVDAGESSRAAARDLLERARAELAGAGDTAASQVRAALSLAPSPGGWPFQSAGGPPLRIPPGSPKAVTEALLLSVLRRLSRADPEQVEELLELHPEWAELLETHPPDAAAANTWWESITDPAVQQALVTAAPAVIGSLGGIPPLVRVAANQLNAASRLDVLEDLLADPGAGEDDLARLEAERGYLQDAVDGEVQLYLYDPETHSIVEMIGTPSADTTTTLTFVPGTFTTMESFYASSVQDVVGYVNTSDPSIVGFVWKEGVFPGEDVAPSPFYGLVELPMATGLTEANDPALAAETGSHLARFQSEMLASNDHLAAAKHDAMGYSWGLAPVTASEGAGAQYDQVHSLAGAGMPAGWVADPNTDYSHWAYTDALTMAQQTGVVWDGNIPAADPAFETHVYARDGDFEVRLPPPGGSTEAVTLAATNTPVENHNLIATDDEENQRVLRAILRKVRE